AAPCHLWAAGWQSRAGQLVPFTARQAGTEHWWFGERQCAAHPGPRDALELVGPPRIGGRLAVAIGDPHGRTGLTPGATYTVWVLGFAEARGGECGVVVPGLGLGGGPGAVLVEVFAPPAVNTAAVRWDGPARPAVHALG